MKKKPYILPKSEAIKVSDPVGNWYAEEDERILGDLIEESLKDEEKPVKTFKRIKFLPTTDLVKFAPPAIPGSHTHFIAKPKVECPICKMGYKANIMKNQYFK
jgi:hypothetical protein